MKKNRPLVSVVIPVFNGALYVEETINSVLKNTFKDIEIILFDDGSKDKSKKICARFAKKYSNVFFYSFAKNKGLGNVLNAALSKARGKYICRLNHDDIMQEERIAKQVSFLENNPDVVAVGSFLTLFGSKKKRELIRYATEDKDIKKTWYVVSPFADPASMYRKEVAQKVGGYKQKFWPAEDLHLWYRMGQKGKLANIGEPLTLMRWHKKAASQRFFKRQILNTYLVHMWAHKNVQKASFPMQGYWLLQLFGGLLLGPTIMWFLYKRVKVLLAYVALFVQKPVIRTIAFRFIHTQKPVSVSSS